MRETLMQTGVKLSTKIVCVCVCVCVRGGGMDLVTELKCILRRLMNTDITSIKSC